MITKEQYLKIEEMLLEIDFNIWDPKRILEPSSFTLGYLCGRNISVSDTSEFFMRMLSDENSKIDKKLAENYGE